MEGKDSNVFKYTFYRIMQLIPVWILLSMVVFAIVHALPGDAIDALVPPDAASNPATRAALEKSWGSTNPFTFNTLSGSDRPARGFWQVDHHPAHY